MAQQLKFIYTLEELPPIGILSPEDYPKLKEYSKILARAPISGVQDVFIEHSQTNRVFIGVNVEFVGLQHSITAEQFLVTNLALNFELRLQTYFDRSRFWLGSIGHPFGSGLLREPHNNHLGLSDICLIPEHCSHPKCWALAAANRSYSECPSGVALICEGEVYRGWFIQSVDYTLSVGPLQAALVDFVARGEGKGFDNIVEAVLVEMKDAKVSQEATTKSLLKTIAPGCDFSVFQCYKTKES